MMLFGLVYCCYIWSAYNKSNLVVDMITYFVARYIDSNSIYERNSSRVKANMLLLVYNAGDNFVTLVETFSYTRKWPGFCKVVRLPWWGVALFALGFAIAVSTFSTLTHEAINTTIRNITLGTDHKTSSDLQNQLIQHMYDSNRFLGLYFLVGFLHSLAKL